ncbi:uncharacterized protein LOC131952597 [Physella acuta]|uniref:uncharacterized protein LOC131952597 n=1 Tax=Physella acuta TaxID=109671 RepID=UPI0027DCAF7E|nr:uncharacterized protein LOC131952597 [Physella acuta]
MAKSGDESLQLYLENGIPSQFQDEVELIVKYMSDEEYDKPSYAETNQRVLKEIFENKLQDTDSAHSHRRNVVMKFWKGKGQKLREAPCIYNIKCKRCKIMYVGSTTNIFKSIYEHVYHISTFDLTNSLYRHYRGDNGKEECRKWHFSFFVIEYVEERKLLTREQFCINSFKTLQPKGLNENTL